MKQETQEKIIRVLDIVINIILVCGTIVAALLWIKVMQDDM